MPERIARHVIEGIQAQAQSREMWTDLAALGVPVLVARGSEGGLVTDDHVDRYRQMVPDVEVVSIRGRTGIHAVDHEVPVLVVPYIEAAGEADGWPPFNYQAPWNFILA